MTRVKTQPKLRLKTFDFSNVRPEQVDWLWKPWLQRGALNLLTGQPGIGKSTLICEIVAALTTGRPLPGDEPRPPVNCLILNSEDAPGNTIKPRLIAQGADMARVWGVSESTSLDEEAVKELAFFIRAHDIGFVSIDPLQGWIGAGTDMHRANETRAWAQYIRAVAVETNAAIMFLRHMRKGTSADTSINAGMGSIDITGFARCEIGAREDKEGQCYVTRVKGNMGRRPVPIAYSIDSQEADSDVGRFTWEGPYLYARAPKANRVPRSLAPVIAWMRDQFACGTGRLVSEIHALGRDQKFSKTNISKAAGHLNLVKNGDLWHLPPDDGPRSNAEPPSGG